TRDGTLAADVQSRERVDLTGVRDADDHAVLLLYCRVRCRPFHAAVLERLALVLVELGKYRRRVDRLGRKPKRRAGAPRTRGRGPDARTKIARAIQHHSTELDDARVGRPEMLARAIGDESLTVLDARVLLGHAANPGERVMLLLDAIDQVIVVTIAHRHPP